MVWGQGGLGPHESDVRSRRWTGLGGGSAGVVAGSLASVVGVGAGLLLRTLARVVCWLYYLSLLARLFSFALGQGFGRGADGRRSEVGAWWRWSGSMLGCCCVR